MNKKIISAMMALTLTMSIGYTSVYADTASDKAKIKQVQTQRSGLETKVEMMDSQIEKIMSKINSNEKNINNTQNNIKQSKINIAKAEDDIKAEQVLYDKRMRVMYMNGTSSYVDILLDSKGIENFISRLEDVKTIINFDQKIIDDLQTKKEAINLKKVALDKENTKLLSLRVDNKNTLSGLTKQKAAQDVLVAQLNTQEAKYTAQLVADQAAAAKQVALAKQAVTDAKNATEARQAAAENQAASANQYALNQSTGQTPSISPSRGGSGASSNALISYASQFLGLPYVWGGTSPTNGFDCSGFTQYVFAHFGVDIPRVSEDQQNVGTLVSRENLQPGDLVFFGTPAHHVGIYVGNGNMINAPHTGAVLRIQSLNSDFTYGRRVR
ncbi:NlpC/P60 family protein [Clostridium estertheticum]|uniref:NlpC/P60 family protein n=1 Tax=Clostridium estertheticum TaxID=238834 RepID=A0AA47I7C2_9CLOT|nr:NlpC/P60 family protein [Clostridium estertheticum]MBU3153380.1 C40 family peptidase [Clostridium estertheticum]WAG60785.1 NlpC/P60 family protein [Clostridium estertheticum]